MENFGQRKKILLLVTQGNWGGAQKYLFDLCCALRNEFEVRAASGGEDSQLQVRLQEAGIHYTGLKNLVRAISPLKDILAFFEIVSLIKKERPDLVHLNSSKAGVLGSIAAHFAGVPAIVFTMHGLVLAEPLATALRWIYFLAEKISAAFTDMLIAVSAADKELAGRFHLKSSDKISVIHNGLNFSALRFFAPVEARDKLTKITGVSLQGKTLVGTIADFYPSKGLSYLVLAAKKITVSRPETAFILIGRGPESKKTALMNLIAREPRSTALQPWPQGYDPSGVFVPRSSPGLSAHHTMVRNLSALGGGLPVGRGEGLVAKFFIINQLDDASAYLKAFDAFVLPSVKEGLPYTVLEAAAAGLPIVATKVGGVPEVIADKKTGLLVPPANPDALAAAINTLLANPRLATRLGRSAAESVKNFSLQKMVEQTKRVYRQLLASR